MRKQLLTPAAIMLAATTVAAAQSTRNDDRQKPQAQETQQKDINISRAASPSAQDQKSKANDNHASSKKQPSSTTGANSTDNNKTDAGKDSKSEASNDNKADAGGADRKPATADNDRQRSTTGGTKKNNDPNASDNNTNRNSDSNRSTDTNRNAHNNRDAGTQRRSNAADNHRNDTPRVSINRNQETKITAAIRTTNVRPVTNVNFSVSVGAVIPTSIELHMLPADVVAIVPQYRGYRFFIVRDEIVIVEPSSKKIVAVISRSGNQATAPERTGTKFTSEQRDTLRRSSRPRTTTGSGATTTTVTVGQRLPDTVELREFDEDVLRIVPSVRTYRYVPSPNGVYLVDPAQRTVIEEID